MIIMCLIYKYIVVSRSPTNEVHDSDQIFNNPFVNNCVILNSPVNENDHIMNIMSIKCHE